MEGPSPQIYAFAKLAKMQFFRVRSDFYEQVLRKIPFIAMTGFKWFILLHYKTFFRMLFRQSAYENVIQGQKSVSRFFAHHPILKESTTS